mgnify:CR=1 FL=1
MARQKKIQSAMAVRDVKANLWELVALGVITKKEMRLNLRSIGTRMRKGRK